MAQGGPIQINFPEINWADLIPKLVGYMFTGVGEWVNKTSHSTLDRLWGSSANVLGQTPLDMTWGFGPVHDQINDVQTAARAVLVFAVILLGLRGMLGGLISSSRYDMLSEFAGGLLPSVILVTAFPLLIPQVIGLVSQASTAVAGSASVSSFVNAGSDGLDDPMVQAILFIILAFFAVRLLVKTVWRIGFLAVLLPFGMVACALHAVPQCRWMLGWWARLWGGMLLAQIPSVFALSIGAGLAAGGSGIDTFVYSIAFLQLATDLYSLIPFGHIQSGGAPWGGWPGRVALLAATSKNPLPMDPAGSTTHMSNAQVSRLYGYQ